MVITACLARGSLAMSRKQTIIKDINAMQGFGSMDVLCMDKTGTLTNESILLEYYMDVLGNESAEALDLAFLNSSYHSGVRNLIDNALLACRPCRAGRRTLGNCWPDTARPTRSPSTMPGRWSAPL